MKFIRDDAAAVWNWFYWFVLSLLFLNFCFVSRMLRAIQSRKWPDHLASRQLHHITPCSSCHCHFRPQNCEVFLICCLSKSEKGSAQYSVHCVWDRRRACGIGLACWTCLLRHHTGLMHLQRHLSPLGIFDATDGGKIMSSVNYLNLQIIEEAVWCTCNISRVTVLSAGDSHKSLHPVDPTSGLLDPPR